MTATTTSQVELDVRAFAAQFPTPNVLAAVAYCESGRLTWGQVYDLCREALSAGLAAVA